MPRYHVFVKTSYKRRMCRGSYHAILKTTMAAAHGRYQAARGAAGNDLRGGRRRSQTRRLPWRLRLALDFFQAAYSAARISGERPFPERAAPQNHEGCNSNQRGTTFCQTVLTDLNNNQYVMGARPCLLIKYGLGRRRRGAEGPLFTGSSQIDTKAAIWRALRSAARSFCSIRRTASGFWLLLRMSAERSPDESFPRQSDEKERNPSTL